MSTGGCASCAAKTENTEKSADSAKATRAAVRSMLDLAHAAGQIRGRSVSCGCGVQSSAGTACGSKAAAARVGFRAKHVLPERVGTLRANVRRELADATLVVRNLAPDRRNASQMRAADVIAAWLTLPGFEAGRQSLNVGEHPCRREQPRWCSDLSKGTTSSLASATWEDCSGPPSTATECVELGNSALIGERAPDTMHRTKAGPRIQDVVSHYAAVSWFALPLVPPVEWTWPGSGVVFAAGDGPSGNWWKKFKSANPKVVFGLGLGISTAAFIAKDSIKTWFTKKITDLSFDATHEYIFNKFHPKQKSCLNGAACGGKGTCKTRCLLPLDDKNGYLMHHYGMCFGTPKPKGGVVVGMCASNSLNGQWIDMDKEGTNQYPATAVSSGGVAYTQVAYLDNNKMIKYYWVASPGFSSFKKMQ